MAASNEHDEQIVTFRLGEGLYGIDIGTVREIIPWSPITKVPRATESVEGIINLRGNVIPVADLRKRFGLDHTSVSRDTRVVVVDFNNFTIGLVVDAVSEVQKIPANDVVPASSIGAGVSADFIRGVAKTDKLIILLNIENILDTYNTNVQLGLRDGYAPRQANRAS